MDSVETEKDEDEQFAGVRLRPVIPVPDDHSKITSWLGGRPRMPKSEPWPQINGMPLQFVCQLDCSSFPTEMWDGDGPREGWLVVFVGGAGTTTPHVVHIDEMGRERKAPRQLDRNHMFSSLPSRAPEGFDFESPRWPVEVVLIDPDSEHEESKAVSELCGGHDLNDPLNRPHDWDTLILMFDVLIANIEQQKKWSKNSVQSAKDVIEEPLEDVSVLAEILEAAKAMLARFEQLDLSVPFDEDLWLPFAHEIVELRRRNLHRDLNNLSSLAGPEYKFGLDQLQRVYGYKIKQSPDLFDQYNQLSRGHTRLSSMVRKDRRWSALAHEVRNGRLRIKRYEERFPARRAVYRRRSDRLFQQ